MNEELLETLRDTISDLALDFLVYDRRDDEEFTSDDIDELVNTKEFIDVATNMFKEELTKHIKGELK